jgi:SOS-response transcriptional repressor LexA
VPVWTWEEILPGHFPPAHPPTAWLACPVAHGEATFALPVLGEAMGGDDGYHEGEILFIDPGVAPAHGRDVVLLQGGTALFRRLVVTPEGRFLKTLNPAWPTPIMAQPDDAVVCGTVIFSGRVR